MNILDRLFGPRITKEPKIPYLTSYSFVQPPERNLQGYLRAFGEVGWLFAVVSKIAQGVAEAEWRLYTKSEKGEYKEVPNHPIMDVINYVNPFQTRQEFIELHEIYMGLVGECFWVINRNKLGVPGEIWIAPPHNMSVVPSKKDFISGYVYQMGNEKVPFEPQEVIHHKLPNPLNPYRGLGPVQAMAIDLDSEMYAAQWNRRFFFNSARPEGLLSFEGILTEEQYDRIRTQWAKRHQGVANANKTGILEGGGKYQPIQFNAKDMDFRALRIMGRDNVLGIYGMPLSVMGITENVNRANAEAGDYTFARWIVTPRLSRLKNKLNEQFLPLFPNSGKNELDYDSVVQETFDQKKDLAESGLRAGYMTINEARQIQNLPPLEGGDELKPPAANPFTEAFNPKRYWRGKSFDPEWKEAYWKRYVQRSGLFEKKMIRALTNMFESQKDEAISRLEAGADHLIDQEEAKHNYVKLAEPILKELLEVMYNNGRRLIEPKPVHTGKAPPPGDPEDFPIPPGAVKWLRSRLLWVAARITVETSKLLDQILEDGQREGWSIPTMTQFIRDNVFGDDRLRSRSELIARTETICASAQGTIEGYKDAGITKSEFLAALDDRICEDCAALDGRIFPTEDCEGIIPVHPDCRCCWIPVIE